MPRIAILIRNPAMLGGSNQYARAVLEVVKARLQARQYRIFCEQAGARHFGGEPATGLPGERFPTLMRFGRMLAGMAGLPFQVGKFRPIAQYRPDLILCAHPSTAGALGLPYVTPVHDLMHRVYTGLPEIDRGERMMREARYRAIARTSLICVVDSQAVKDQLRQFYRRAPESIEIIREIPPPYVFAHYDMLPEQAERLVQKYDLPERFLFYPAHFWSHKNHLRLLQALAFLKDRYGLAVPIVFVGARKEAVTYQNLIDYLADSPIRPQVKFLGYVDDVDMVALYRQSLALVFPSINISTGIPVAEATFLEKPVLCSDLASYREQLDGAGLLFDPFSVEDMAEKIRQVWQDPGLQQTLTRRAAEKKPLFSFETFAMRWHEVIEGALAKVAARSRRPQPMRKALP
jgi:glycosyltransferase involved in cell wall biosynthesis